MYCWTLIEINLEHSFIGFPDYILNSEKLDEEYQPLKLMENTYFQNNIKIRKFTMNKELSRINKPVNKTRWDMSPPTVNAYYSPSRYVSNIYGSATQVLIQMCKCVHYVWYHSIFYHRPKTIREKKYRYKYV